MSTRPPINEVGYQQPDNYLPGGVAPPGTSGLFHWSALDLDAQEHVPELRFPNSIKMYDRMRSDPQIDALLRGLFYPIRRFRWQLAPNGAKSRLVTALSEDLGIPVVGKETKRKRISPKKLNFDLHIREALLAAVYGFMYFEQVGKVEDGMWRLKKLAARMPQTIDDIGVARDGGLVYIKQRDEYQAPVLSVDRLLAYIFDKEGANWWGRSLLRAAYQPWLLKDRLLRVDAIRHERNGMGVPIVTLPERATAEQKREGNALAQQYKTGMASGGALPNGMTLDLVGVKGSTSDVLASIRYHDEAMAKLMIQAFMNLGGGGEYGSKALGDTFAQQTSKAQETVADWIAETFTNYMIYDWVVWNYGEDEQPPVLTYTRDEDPELSAHEFAQLVAQQVLTVDDETEGWLRDKYGLPQLKGPRPVASDFGLPSPGPNDGNAPPDEGQPNENVAEPPAQRTARA